MNKENLPYFKRKEEDKKTALFLQRKFKKNIKEKMPYHYTVEQRHFKMLEYLKTKKEPYFLRFDIKAYYPSIEHKLILKEIPLVYQKLTDKDPSRRFVAKTKKEIPLFLKQSPYQKGLPLASHLSQVLSSLFLLNLDIEISKRHNFLRFVDDYIIFFRNKKEPQSFLEDVIIPETKRLNLEINSKKLSSGKFHRNKVDFIGFNFHGGHFTIKSTEEFKKKINKITYLTKRKPDKAVIKELNNKILGFAHYYKFSSCTTEFKTLDHYIRMRVRRYISRNKENKNRTSNLVLRNEILKSMGLKSLKEIKEKYDRKNKHISKKRGKKKIKSGKTATAKNCSFLEEKAHYYEQKMILEELKKITSLLDKINKRKK